MSFEILDDTSASQVRAARQEAAARRKMRPDDLSPRVLLIGVYLDHGLIGEALAEAREAERERPDDPQVKALVKSLRKLLWPFG